MIAPATPRPGATCHLGKGKTLWEIITVNEHSHQVELSALGKGGYSNRNAGLDELTQVMEQQVTTTLGTVIRQRALARAAAANLNDRLRFADAFALRDLAQSVHDLTISYTHCVEGHNEDLAALGIKAD